MSANTMNTGQSGMGGVMGGSRVEEGLDQTTNRAHETVDRVADRITPAVERAAEKAHQTIDTVAQRAAPAAQWAQDRARQLSDTTNQYVDEWSNYVRERPLTSVGVALAVGYLLGRLMR